MLTSVAQNKVFFIINKYSGTGFQSSIEGKIIDACGRYSLEATLEYTTHKGHATELAQQAVAEGYERVFVVGGDGTVNEVAQGLVNTGVALGILPKGSGNGLARHLQIPLRMDRALRLLHRYQTVPIDTLRINDTISINVSGVGFDAHVASKFGKNGKRGLLGYAKLILREFRRFKEFEVKASLDDQVVVRKSFIVAIANSSQFGNNVRVAPHASVCDGEMEICFIRKVPLQQALGFTARMFTGRVTRSKYIEIKKASRFVAEFSEAIPYHIDGESYPATDRLTAEIQPASIHVMLPATVKKKF
jgi:YegS/Rv2252/BmrU family lipid kinase